MKKFDQSLNRKPSIFISYSWNDKDEVDYYQEKLVNVGFEVSRDINKISGNYSERQKNCIPAQKKF